MYYVSLKPMLIKSTCNSIRYCVYTRQESITRIFHLNRILLNNKYLPIYFHAKGATMLTVLFLVKIFLKTLKGYIYLVIQPLLHELNNVMFSI